MIIGARSYTPTAAPRDLAIAMLERKIVAVLIRGARAPVLISKKIVGQMKRGSVIVDVAIDQGCCVETSRPTTHDNQT